jgi:hypothetical protein
MLGDVEEALDRRRGFEFDDAHVEVFGDARLRE